MGRGVKMGRDLQYQGHALAGSLRMSRGSPFQSPSLESLVRVSSVHCAHPPRCWGPHALGQCGRQASGRCARCMWQPLHSLNSCCDRRGRDPSVAASRRGLSTVDAASELADCSPREFMLATKPRCPTVSLSCGGCGNSLGVQRKVGRVP